MMVAGIGPRSALSAGSKRLPDTRDEGAVGQRLLQHLAHPRARREAAQPLVGTTGDQDRRHGDIAAPQGIDQLQAVHDGHAVVDDETAAARQIKVGQQRLRPRIEADPEAFDLERELECAADGSVVIDDQDSPEAGLDTSIFSRPPAAAT